MAPRIRYTPIPATLWDGESPFVTQLSAKAQWLYLLLWTSEARDSAGFLPLQPGLWAKCSKTTSVAMVRASLDELCAEGWLMVDEHMEKVWLRRFIREDAFNNPNYYVSAVKRIPTCPSGMLRRAAWEEVQRLGLPAVNSESPDTREKMAHRMQAAYDALRQQMLTEEGDTPPKGDRRGIDTPPKGSYVNAHGDGSAGAPQKQNANGQRNPSDSVPPSGLLCTNGCDSPAGFSASDCAEGIFCEDCALHGGVAPQWR